MRHHQLLEQFMMHTESLQDELLLRLIMVRHLPLRAPFRTATPCPAEGGTASPLEPANKWSQAHTHVSLSFKYAGALDFRIEQQAPPRTCTPRTALVVLRQARRITCTNRYSHCHKPAILHN
jgi:hypothetical protein